MNSTAFNVSWDEIPPVERNGLIVTYEVLYAPLATFGGILMPDSVNTSDLYVVLNNLQEFVLYNVSVRAYTSEGPGPYSDGLTQITPEDSKFMRIISLYLYFVANNYATVQVLLNHRLMLKPWQHHLRPSQ